MVTEHRDKSDRLTINFISNYKTWNVRSVLSKFLVPVSQILVCDFARNVKYLHGGKMYVIGQCKGKEEEKNSKHSLRHRHVLHDNRMNASS